VNSASTAATAISLDKDMGTTFFSDESAWAWPGRHHA